MRREQEVQAGREDGARREASGGEVERRRRSWGLLMMEGQIMTVMMAERVQAKHVDMKTRIEMLKKFVNDNAEMISSAAASIETVRRGERGEAGGKRRRRRE